MRLLDRYLLRELLIPLAYCLGGFLIFWISFDLIGELGRFQEQALPARDIARYYAFKTPEFLVLILPVALLLALLYSLTNHARHHELTAIRAAGVSLWRLSAPYLALGFALSLGLFALNELWVPAASQAAEELVTRRAPAGEAAPDAAWQSNLAFRNARDGRIWTIDAYHLATAEMRNPQVEWRQPDGSRRTLLATNATRVEGVWVFHDVHDYTYPAPAGTNPVATLRHFVVKTHTNRLAVPEFSETPEEIRSQIKVSKLNTLRAAREIQLSIAEIVNYLELHPDEPSASRAMLHTQLHGRLAAPWTALVVVLIAIPFGALSGRRNVFVGVASSIFICFAYFIVLRFGLALGTGGYLPPWIAAWTPNVIFAAAGVWATLQVR